MNQKEIKLPITCNQLAKIIWLSLVFVSIIYVFSEINIEGDPYFDHADLGVHLVIFGFLLVSSIIIVVDSGYKLLEWLTSKPRLPFRFSCKCEVSDND